MKYLGLMVIIGLFVSISAIIWVGILLGSFCLKKKICKMDGEKWGKYLSQMTATEYLTRGGIMYALALAISSTCGYFVFQHFSYENPLVLSVIIFVLGGVKATFHLTKNKEKLMDKLQGIKTGEY